MTKDNELIAEFLGLERSKDIWENGEFAYTMKFQDVFNKWVIPSNMKFSTSLDWLIVVVERIEKLGAIIEINLCLATSCRIIIVNKNREPIKQFLNGGSIPVVESIFLSVIEFLKYIYEIN